jgi:hypothetical protein
MPYLHLDLPGTYPIEVKPELAMRLCKLCEKVQTQLWRPNVGIAELGEHNLYHLGPDGLEPSSRRTQVKRSSATETGPQTGHPRRPLRLEVH